MATSIFTLFADLSKEFPNDFALLWNLTKEQRNLLLKYLSEISKVEVSDKAEELMAKAVLEVGGNSPDVLRALKSLLFISNEWNPIKDKGEDFIKDFAALKLIPIEKEKEALEFLTILFDEIQRDNQRRLNKRYANSLIPSFTGITSLIDFRTVFEQPYQYGDDLDKYSPKCLGFIPVVLICLQRSGEENKLFEFQCEPEDLDLIISRLQAIAKDLHSARVSLSGGKK